MREMREPSPPSPDAPLISVSQLWSRRDSVANLRKSEQIGS